MALLGKAAVAMWWNISPEIREEFEDWHSHEHFPERVGIPGFLRSSRWASATGSEGFFVMYELESYDTLTSPHYLERLNHPTPWSVKMMPHHRNMVRSQAVVLESAGGAIAQSVLTLRLSPAPGEAERLHQHIGSLLPALVKRPGVTAAHLLQTRTPAIAPTEEQKIRGGDAAADWILLVGGYDAGALARLRNADLGDTALIAQGAASGLIGEVFHLRHSLLSTDAH